MSCSFNIVFHRAEIFKVLMKFSCQSWLPRWLSGKESACSAGDAGLIPGSGRSPGEGKGKPLQYTCLGNPVDGGY